MSLYYTHLLIPERADFVPQSQQVVAFLDGLTQLGSTPLDPKFKLGKPGGSRMGRNFVTGETITIPTRPLVTLSGITEVGTELADINDYDLVMEGRVRQRCPHSACTRLQPRRRSSGVHMLTRFAAACERSRYQPLRPRPSANRARSRAEPASSIIQPLGPS
jgi:hypothetical protein